MHAIQPPPPSLRPLKPARTNLRPQRNIQSQPHRAIATEVGAKLAVNLVLAIAAGSALVRLLPYGLSQQAKLQEIRAEVSFVESRVVRVQGDFDRNFDPQQAQAVMQEQSSRVDPHQRQIVWVTPANRTTDPSP